jgi:hypothetical protein
VARQWARTMTVESPIENMIELIAIKAILVLSDELEKQ